MSLWWGGEGQTQGKPYVFAYLDRFDFFSNLGENCLLKPLGLAVL